MDEREPFIEGIQNTVEKYGFRFDKTHYSQPSDPFLKRRYWGFDRYTGQPLNSVREVILDIAAISQGGLDILFNGISIQAMIEDGIPSGASLIQPPPYKSIEEVIKAINGYSNLEGWRRLQIVE